MISRLTLIALVTSQLLTGCASDSTGDPDSPAVEEPGADVAVEEAQPEKEAATEAPPPPPKRIEEPGAGPMPPKFAGIHEILKAASTVKEPNNSHFNAHPQPTVALRWFARYGSSEQVRIFALRALGLYPTPSNSEVLSEVAMNTSEPPLVRAAAIRGIGRYDLEAASHEKIKKFIFVSVSGEDLELACASADAMHGMPTARPILLALAEGTKTPPILKSAAERALGPQTE